MIWFSTLESDLNIVLWLQIHYERLSLKPLSLNHKDLIQKLALNSFQFFFWKPKLMNGYLSSKWTPRANLTYTYPCFFDPLEAHTPSLTKRPRFNKGEKKIWCILHWTTQASNDLTLCRCASGNRIWPWINHGVKGDHKVSK